MASEFDRAEAALSRYAAGESADGEWPSVAQRVRQARERCGLTFESIAEQLGIHPSEYWDLEIHDDEAFTCMSVDELAQISSILGISVDEMLFDERDAPPGVQTPFEVVAARLVDVARQQGLTIAELGDRVGWELADAIANPASLGALNVAGLRDVCEAVGVEWRTALPRRSP